MKKTRRFSPSGLFFNPFRKNPPPVFESLKRENDRFMLHFDEKGHLQPPEPMETTLAEFELFFVENLDDRAHRRQLFENYLRFLEQLKTLLEPPFFQWIDGSFVTRKARPNDLDVVTFIDFEAFESKAYELTWLNADAMIDGKIHAHAAYFFEKGHFRYDDYLATRQLWSNIFRNVKTDGHQLKNQKGFIQLNFER